VLENWVSDIDVLCCAFLHCAVNNISNTTFKVSVNVLTIICSFLRQHLGSIGPETADVEALKLEVTDLRQKVEKLNEENAELKQKVCNLFSYDVICLFSLIAPQSPFLQIYMIVPENY